MFNRRKRHCQGTAELTAHQALQWLWPLILLSGLPFAPESPYWLVRQGRKSDARQALVNLSSSKNPPDIDLVLMGIEQTDLLEQELEVMSSYWDCFKGVHLVRTEISVMVYLIQVIGGNPLIGYANYFFEQAGLDPSDAFNSKFSSGYLSSATCFSTAVETDPCDSGRRQYSTWVCRHGHVVAVNQLRACSLWNCIYLRQYLTRVASLVSAAERSITPEWLL